MRTKEELEDLIADFKRTIADEFLVEDVDFSRAINDEIERRTYAYLTNRLGHLKNKDFFRLAALMTKQKKKNG